MTQEVTVPTGINSNGRKASINRQLIIDAAIELVGPHRSIASLSLREVARQAHIAPNSFYRHFKDTNELAIAVIEEAGVSLRKIIREARQLISQEHSAVRSSVESFMKQLDHDQNYLPILLREGHVGSDAFKIAVNNQLQFFEHELEADLQKIATISASNLVAKAVTRLVFAMASEALVMTPDERKVLTEDVIVMVKMILRGARFPSGKVRQ